MQYDGRKPEPPYPTDSDEKDARITELEKALTLIAEWADQGRHEEDFSAIAKKARSLMGSVTK